MVGELSFLPLLYFLGDEVYFILYYDLQLTFVLSNRYVTIFYGIFGNIVALSLSVYFIFFVSAALFLRLIAANSFKHWLTDSSHALVPLLLECLKTLGK